MWIPPSNYIFPISKKNEKCGLRFQYKWLMEFQWLAYSEEKNGAFCKFCVIFAKVGGKNGQPLGYFVKTAFDVWKNAKFFRSIFDKTLIIFPVTTAFNYNIL